MRTQSEPSTHIWLAQRMQALSAAELAGAMQAAGLTPADWAAMTSDCQGCTSAGDCGKFLALHTRQDIEPAEDTHRNRGRFRLLKSALEEMGH